MIFEQPILEGICRVLGEYASGTQITTYLAQLNITDVDGPQCTKWRRLYSTFAAHQNHFQDNTKILEYICLECAPSRYADNEDNYIKLLEQINLQLAFCGLELLQNGRIQKIDKAETISDAQKKATNLKIKLEQRDTHSMIFQYCKSELLQNNYFHAVFEAMKGLMQRIRIISGSSLDGTKLIEYIFSKEPVLIINNFQTQSEKDEHAGFCNILRGLCGMFRNTEAHEPKVTWEISEQDALEILSMVSYCHRRLDASQKIRLADY